MASRNYKIGRSFEYRTQDYFRDRGYYVIRAYASRGLYDLIAVPSTSPPNSYKYPKLPFLIQCKNHGKISKKELDNLIKNDKWNGIVVIAFSKKGKMTFRNLQGIEYEL